MGEIVQQTLESGFRQRMEQIDHNRFGRKLKLAGVQADCLQRTALLRITAVFGDILQGHAMKLRQEFDSDDPPEWIVRSHQQRPTLARANVDESEIAKI